MKIGLFFGSFNPIHSGHVAVADYMAEHSGLDEIWFIVSPQNPLKSLSSLVNEQDRLAMVNLAIEGHVKLRASDFEFNLPKPSFTINSIQHLKKNLP